MRATRTILAGLCLAMLAVLLAPAAMSQADPVQAYVPPDFGDTTAIVVRLEALGWTVTTTYTLDLEGEDPYSSFDVVWIVSDSSDDALRHLRDPAGDLSKFAKGGGVLVIVDVGGDVPGLDLAPGGVNAMGLPEGGAGSVTIVAADHPLITGAGAGGVVLTEADLDPGATGGLGYLSKAPDGFTVIAENTSGPTLLEYTAGDGHVVVCALHNPSSACADNIALYAESLIP